MRSSIFAASFTVLAVALFATGCPGPAPLTPDGGTQPGGDGGTNTLVVDAGVPDAGGPSLPDPSFVREAETTRRVTVLAADDMNGRDDGTPGGLKARAFIIEQMQACGLRPAGVSGYEQPITNGVGTNVIARVDGTDPALSDRVVILSAHYDHLGSCGGAICNGANDNAAAVSAMIAVGCALAQTPPRRSVLFVAWDAEEPPTFLKPQMGSNFYVANPIVPLEKTDVAIVLDLLGAGMWDGFAGNYLLGSETSDGLNAAVQETAAPFGLKALRGALHLAEKTPLGSQQPWSDYDAFRNRGVPVLFMSDGQNKRYHTKDDEVSKLDLPKLALEAQYLLDLTWKLANLAQTPTFKPNGASDATDAKMVVATLEAALAPGGLVEKLSLSAATKTKLEADLTAAKAVDAKISAGTALGAGDVQTLRTGTQRVMCLAGSSYPATLCNAF